MSDASPPWNLDGKHVKPLLGADRIQQRIAELGREIAGDYREVGEDLVVLGVLKGSVVFMADLMRSIELPLTIDFIGVASYGDATRSSGVVQITQDLTKPIADKHVLVVEDIVDTGHTVHYLLANLATRAPASIKLCSLLHKPERGELEVTIDYLGFTIPDLFVVGYGLDLAQRYRNLPYIGVIES